MTSCSRLARPEAEARACARASPAITRCFVQYTPSMASTGMSYLYSSQSSSFVRVVMSIRIERMRRVGFERIEDGQGVVAQRTALLREEFDCRAVAFIYGPLTEKCRMARACAGAASPRAASVVNARIWRRIGSSRAFQMVCLSQRWFWAWESADALRGFLRP